MAKIEHSIDIGVPVREAYDQWTQFESFPEFMEGVESVKQTDATHLHWIADHRRQATGVGRRDHGTDPDQRIAWTSITGDANAGSVDFHRLGEETTRVTLTMDVEPSGIAEKVGTAIGIPSGQVKGDLERFRDFIERRGSATGSWRGEIRAERRDRLTLPFRHRRRARRPRACRRERDGHVPNRPAGRCRGGSRWGHRG